MTAPRVPSGLVSRGRRLWREMHEVAEFNPAETVLLHEACRIVDRLDRLDAVLSGGEFLKVGQDADGGYVLRVDGALAAASRDANVLKQIVAALRLPDEAGRRPQFRGPRGVQQPSKAKIVSSLDRARARSGASPGSA